MSEYRPVMAPPNNVDAEKSVLSAMLQDSKAVLLAVEMLEKDEIRMEEMEERIAIMTEGKE